MALNGNGIEQWKFRGNEEITKSSISVRGILNLLSTHLNEYDSRPLIPFGRVDPSSCPSFRTASFVVEALTDAVNSYDFNSYPPTVGILPARRALAEYLSSDLSYQLSPDDVFLTIGCTQAIEIIISVLARPGANILLPRPGYPQYEARAAFEHLEVRHFDLIPEKGWEVDLDAVEALSDANTTAIVIINPSNPCGSVYTYQHLKEIAETARKLGILVISDEVYGRLAFGSKPFVPMGEFGSIAPVLTLGSISKRWVVPGWRLGWIATTDPNGILKKRRVVEIIKSYLDITCDPPVCIQGAIPKILQKTEDEFFSNVLEVLRENANVFYDKINKIPCFTCPNKPEGAMVAMVKLNLEHVEGINAEMDFCCKLAEEESVLVLPGIAVGMKNWLRMSLAMERDSLEDGLIRLKNFYERHASSKNP